MLGVVVLFCFGVFLLGELICGVLFVVADFCVCGGEGLYGNGVGVGCCLLFLLSFRCFII